MILTQLQNPAKRLAMFRCPAMRQWNGTIVEVVEDRDDEDTPFRYRARLGDGTVITARASEVEMIDPDDDEETDDE